MRNLEEQSLIVKPIIYTVVSLIIFAGLVMVLFVPVLAPTSPIAAAMLSVSFLEKAINAVNGSTITAVLTFVLMICLFVILPLPFVARGYKLRYRKSRFPEGIDKRKFKATDHFICDQIVSFLRAGGLTVKKGFDAEEVFTRRGKHFASVRFMNRSVYVLIDRDYSRPSPRPDRAGYIAIRYPEDLDVAKDRIHEAYRLYFQ